MRRGLVSVSSSLVVACLTLLPPSEAAAEDFAAGSLIIPMDIDYQDMGMLRAFGLVYALLAADVPVNWVIRADKLSGEVDFMASAIDLQSGMAIPLHGYRGGPWVIDAIDAAAALPIIEAWQLANPTVKVHEASADFQGDVARRLVVAPTIAMIADGNQKIARKYMQAAAIPDSTGSVAWSDLSPDMLDIIELSGPTEADHADGSLFDEDGDPVYCQLMSMHWGVNDAINDPEVVAEVREYLNNPVHFFAECQAVNAFENHPTFGHFLTPNGFLIGQSPGQNVQYFNAQSPYAQIDGAFQGVGGSEPAYTLPNGDMYLAGGTTLITAANSPAGINDVWMNGFLGGACNPTQAECGSVGKVSYLGGHEYKTTVPISANPDSQGARLFLNSLFEAPCATEDGLPLLTIDAGAPAFVDVPMLDVAIHYDNISFATALDGAIRAPIPAGATFVSATAGGVEQAGEVVWDVGNLGPNEAGDLGFTLQLSNFGVYSNSALLDYRVGLNLFTLPSNVVDTLYDDMPPDTTGTGTDTMGADTSGTDTMGTDTSGADTSGADTSGADTSGADTTNGSTDAGTDTNGGTDAGTSGSGSGGDTSASGSDGADEVADGADADPPTGEVVEGCACEASERSEGKLAWMLGLGLLLGVRRRRS